MRWFAVIAVFIASAGFAASSSTNLPAARGDAPGFTLLAPESTGVNFTNVLSDQGAAANQIRYNGSGVALGDIDGDGLCDIFLCGLESSNVLYKNLGNLRFSNVTSSAGLGAPPHDSTGAVFADVDGDNDLDLLVNSIGGGSTLYLNDGAGKFKEAHENGLVRRFGATSAAFGDVDGDGLLDLYVANYRAATIRSTGFALLRRGNQTFVRPEDRDHLEITAEGRVLEKGESDFLYHNRGNGQFSAFSWTKGLFRDENNEPLREAPREWGLAVMFRDLNNDGAPDLYVCNDFFSPDHVWINAGNGFRALPQSSIKATSTFSMSVDVADINRDGFDDIFVGDMLRRDHLGHALAESAGPMLAKPAGGKQERPQLLRNTLQLNRGDNTYAEISQFAGLDASDWTWSAIFCDVDLDGYEDLLCATGQMFDTQDLDADARINALGPWPREKIPQKVLMYPRLPMKNLAFRNRGDLKFEDVSAAWGFNYLSVANAMALADLDNDGDLDVVINNLNGVAQIYLNNSAAPRVAVRLKGRAPNTRGIGARIIVHGGAVATQSQEMICGGRYLSSDDTIRVFAAASGTNTLSIEALWRGGGRTIVENVKPNTLQVIDEAEAQPYTRPAMQQATAMFTDVSDSIGHTHVDPTYDDFSRQPTLPHRLSQLGPGVTWADINNDGRDDLILPNGNTGSLKVYANQGDGKFSPSVLQGVQNHSDDQTTVLSWPISASESLLIIAGANYESGDTNPLRTYKIANGVAQFQSALSLVDSSPGAICAADVDGDGDVDLFIGGRVIPGQYPAPARSRLFLNTNNNFVPAQEFRGLVSGAVFSNLDLDGGPELILASDWGPIRVYKWTGSKYEEQSVGLEKFSGWWNGVTTADVNGDGLLDIIATNWGENTKYERFKNGLRVHYGNWSGNLNLEMIESFWSPDLKKEVPIRGLDLLKKGAPDLAHKFASYAAYSQASISDIIPPNQPALEVTYFKSAVFLNRTNRFECVALPSEAQLAPAFGVAVADFDGDGIEDLFLAQNFTDPDNDAFWNNSGRGIILRGNGDGTFKSLSALESGVQIEGDGRGCALADFNNDGRIDLAVAQNRGKTRLYANASAKPGVHLKGAVVGAIVRVSRAGKFTAAQEVKLGSGYWSQDSLMLLVPFGDELQIRWPSGKSSSQKIAAGATELTVERPR